MDSIKVEDVIENFEPRAKLIGVRANPNLDNNIPENWTASGNIGSPGSNNN